MAEPSFLSEKLASASQQPSNELYLIPRNCWVRMTSIKLRTQSLEAKHKIRIKICVPNSGRVMKTSYIQVDDSLLQHLSTPKSIAQQSKPEFSDIPIDIVAVCEYKHDARYSHQSLIEFQLELTSSFLSYTKCLGSATVDMASVIQAPFAGIIQLKKDANIVASLSIQIHSLSLSSKIPIAESSHMPIVSDSDAEPLTDFTQAIRSGRVILIDSTSIGGQKLLKSLCTFDSIVPVSEDSQIRRLFDDVAQFLAGTDSRLRFLICGDDYFICRVFRVFLPVRETFGSDSVSFFVIPISPNGLDLAQRLGLASAPYSETFLKSEWLSIFGDGQQDPIQTDIMRSAIELAVNFKVQMIPLRICDVLLSTSDSQFAVPMLHDVQVGVPNRSDKKPSMIQMKVSVSGEKNKDISVKFPSCVISNSGDGVIKLKYQSEEKETTKLTMKASKGQAPIDIKIDNVVYKAVTGFAVSVREPDLSLLVCIPQKN